MSAGTRGLHRAGVGADTNNSLNAQHKIMIRLAVVINVDAFGLKLVFGPVTSTKTPNIV